MRSGGGIEVSIIIATRDRPRELVRCLDAIARQRTRRSYEVVVVDDGSSPQIALDREGVRLLRLEGAGPAVARNAGARLSVGETILFTDDDTIPTERWLEAAAVALEDRSLVGVDGPTVSPPFDPVRQHSIETPGRTYLTCNVAYRREVFEAVGGFHEGFPYPHAEDLDLLFRIRMKGRLGFAEDMVVLHPPHDRRMRDKIRRGVLIESDLLLRDRHPERFDDYKWLPRELRPVAGVARGHLRTFRREGGSLLRPRHRVWQFALIACGETFIAARTALKACLRNRRL